MSLNFAGDVLAEVAKIAFNVVHQLITGDVPGGDEKRRSSATIDSRLAKIDSARDSLADALEAMDELRRQAEDNKQTLETLNRAVDSAAKERHVVESELNDLRTLATLDTDAVRKALRMPTRIHIWAERLIGFLIGVAASFAATALWQFIF